MPEISKPKPDGDVADRIGEGWSPSPVPLAIPGSPEVPRMTLRDLILPPAPPSLCRLGPCRHYHELRAIMPAQGVGDSTQVVRTCYPHAGVEMSLADTPVLECSLWYPETRRQTGLRDDDRLAVMASTDGLRYQEELQAWRADVKALEDAAVAAANGEAGDDPDPAQPDTDPGGEA